MARKPGESFFDYQRLGKLDDWSCQFGKSHKPTLRMKKGIGKG
jgi:hypothetical protein